MDARAGRPGCPSEVRREFWLAVRAGVFPKAAGRSVGVSAEIGRLWFRQRGGVMPPPSLHVRVRSLSFAEREQIAELRAAKMGVRAIARELGRHPSTISRELRRVQHHRPSDRHIMRHRTSTAQADADRRARREKPAKLATNPRLRKEVQDRLKIKHSPEQIAHRLREDFPDDPEMWVSHETIYQALYIQSRGALKRELTEHLRTGRTLRKPRRRSDERRGRLKGTVMISQRPPEVEDRAVPGHWEGDLILGSAASGSAVGTLVERQTRFTMLLHLPGRHTADAVQEAWSRRWLHCPTN